MTVNYNPSTWDMNETTESDEDMASSLSFSLSGSPLLDPQYPNNKYINELLLEENQEEEEEDIECQDIFDEPLFMTRAQLFPFFDLMQYLTRLYQCRYSM